MAAVFQEDAPDRAEKGTLLAKGCGDIEVGGHESFYWNAEAVKENCFSAHNMSDTKCAGFPH